VTGCEKLLEIRSVIGWMISGTKSKLYRVTTQEQVPRKLIQTRVLTNCPLCGFKQRLERLTGGEYQITDPGDFLPLEVGAIYAEKRAHGLVYEARELRLKPGQRTEILEALAAKMLPFIQYLQLEVPGFREALESREFTVTPVYGVNRPVTTGGQDNLKPPVSRGREVSTWQKVQGVLPNPKSLPASRGLTQHLLAEPAEVPVSRTVEVTLPANGISITRDDSV